MSSSLTLTQEQHQLLRHHLFPGDEREAAAVLVCSRAPGPRVRLLVKEVQLVPYVECIREPDRLVWPGLALEAGIEAADAQRLSIVLIHSHPSGFFAFSEQDNDSDRITMLALFCAIEELHGTAIMTPDGAILARVYEADQSASLLDSVAVIGDDLRWWWSDGEFKRLPMAFSGSARDLLARLRACVIGVSGTGSIVAEQLARLGFGTVQLIDFDRVEAKNLNRILNSTLVDARQERHKVDVLAQAIAAYRGTDVAIPMPTSVATREAVLLASQADILFSCVDSLEGRYIADLMSAAFLQPLFDVGVVIPTRSVAGQRAVADVFGRIDYVRPDGTSLGERAVYTPETLRAEYLKNANPMAHKHEVMDGYIRGTPDQAPSVISLNMHAASLCVLEFIARTFPFRHDHNDQYARTQISLAGSEMEHIAEEDFVSSKVPRPFARGAMEPLLGLPSLGVLRRRGSA